MNFNWRTISLFAIALLAPLGTRYIFATGNINGFMIEQGTISIYATQLLVLAYTLPILLTAEKSAIKKLLTQPIIILAAIFTDITLFSAFFSENPFPSLLQASWTLLGFLLLLAIRIHKPSPRLVLTGFIASGLLQSGFAISQFLTQQVHASTILGMAPQNASILGVAVVETLNERWLRAYGTLPHPNILGFFLSISILSTIGIAFISAHKKYRLLLTTLPILSAGMFFTLSRAVIISQISGLILFISSFFTDKSAKHNAWRAAMAFVIVVATAFTLSAIFREPIMTRLTGNGRLEPRTITERIDGINDARELITQHPLLGVGAGRMPYILASTHPERQPYELRNTHNVSLLITAETGIANGILAFILLVLILTQVFRNKKYLDESTSVQAAIIGLWCTVIAATLFDHYIWSVWSGVLVFWLIAAITLPNNLDKIEEKT